MKYIRHLIMELGSKCGLTMLFHSVIIGLLLYVFMVFALGQKHAMAVNRSLLIAALVLIYMLLFGHGWPTSMKSI